MFEAMMESANDSIVFDDLEGRHIEVSQKKADNWGKTRIEMRGLTDFDLMEPDEAQQSRDDSLRVIETGESIINARRKAIRKNVVVWYSVNKEPWFDENGKIIGTKSTSRDITEQVEQEERLVKTSQQLLEMITMVNHDLVAPITNIIALAKLSSKGNFGPEDQRVSLEMNDLIKNAFLELYHRTTKLRGSVYDYLHSFSNLTEGQEFEKELLDVRAVIDEVIEELEELILDNNSTIDSSLGEMPHDAIFVHANRIQLKITYRNLIQNALKHGGRNGVISFGFERFDAYYILNVFNSGPPVPNDEIPYLFEPFVQGRCVTKGDGFGIGLCTIRNMIRSNGGDMWYETTLSNHPNFRFTLLR